MINSNDVRLGNLILCKDGVIRELRLIDNTIDHYIFRFDDGYAFYDIEVIPIPLSEEWLLKFGFERINHQMSMNDGSINYHYELKGGRYWILYFNGKCFSVNEPNLFKHYLQHNKYVHQLQNLYFCLSGKELQINIL